MFFSSTKVSGGGGRPLTAKWISSFQFFVKESVSTGHGEELSVGAYDDTGYLSGTGLATQWVEPGLAKKVWQPF